jgi:pimeloyl-ACP methyl ester carboxylesterase
MVEGIYKLADGRRMAYAIYGFREGYPVLYFHGTPSSRLEPLLLRAFDMEPEALLRERKICLIAIDRPGMGLSTFDPMCSFLSVAADARQLLNHLQILHCSVLCWSGGGPYALAMAHQFPQYVDAVYILCGFSRCFDEEVVREMGLNKWYFRSAYYLPFILRSCLNIVNLKESRTLPPRALTGLPEVDYYLMKDPVHLKAITFNTIKEACRIGSKGAVQEARNYFGDFGFRLSSIGQPVHYWWGTEDTSVVKLHPLAVEQEIKQGFVHYCPGEGHLSVYIRCFLEALEVISKG